MKVKIKWPHEPKRAGQLPNPNVCNCCQYKLLTKIYLYTYYSFNMVNGLTKSILLELVS